VKRSQLGQHFRGDAVSAKPQPHFAYHEAGHATAALALGIAVESVTIIPDENYERGEVFAAALMVLVEPLKLHDNANVETAALIVLAGEVAQ
jgi:ATP-dependent Zn protease